MTTPEAWLRGPVEGVPAALQPVAHALLQAREDARRFVQHFPAELLWTRPARVASVGFHLQHITGVVDRLFTYARGESLSSEQQDRLAREGQPNNGNVDELLNAFDAQVARALDQLRAMHPHTLTDARVVGRKQLPSTVLGLLFHAAEHVQRHVGQLLVTARVQHEQERLIIRDATHDDIPALAALHVKTWSDTYPSVKPPTYQTRERQWREQFEITDGSWFCFVVEHRSGELIGFAKGKKYASDDLPGYGGELNKIYLLREYQRRGLGRRLVGHVARRFLSQGITKMVLFGTPQNPSCAFHEALGGERLYAANGEFHGGYSWRDLQTLASICPIDSPHDAA
jgi:GNAT superfamily N-acetyltransferase/uncharacterized damage-inducible protein DinB